MGKPSAIRDFVANGIPPAGSSANSAPVQADADAPAPADGDAPAPADPNAPEKTAPGSSLVKDPNFEKLIEALEADEETAQSEWKSQTADSLFNFLSPDVHTQYNADGTDCAKAHDEFNTEWNKIQFGKGDPAKLLAAFNIFWLRIAALQTSNARINAFIAIKVATQLTAVGVFLRQLSIDVLKLRINARLKALITELEKAESEVTNAKWKMGLNIAVSAITLVLAPEEALGKVAVGFGAVTVHIVIDEKLGEGSAEGKVVFVAGESQEAVEAVSEPFKEAVETLGVVGKKSFGVAGAAFTAILDKRELDEAREKVERLQQETEELQKAFDDLMAGLIPRVPKFIALEKAMIQMNDVIAKAMSSANDAKKDYDEIKQEIEKAIREGS